MTKNRLSSALFALVLLASTALSQEFRGTITGTVTDAQGAVVAGANIEARSLGTNAVLRTTTNGSGVYVLPFLGIGHYSVTAAAPGFKKSVRSDIELRVTDRVQVDFTMELGAVSEEVTVVSEAQLLETEDASHGQVIDTKAVMDAPLLGRNTVMLTLLSTGITWANPQPSNSERPWDNNGMENFNMNGSQGLTNQFLLDGIPNTSVENTGPANLTVAVSQDATAEFKVQTNAYDAEYGRTGGGTVNISLKSGTNRLHGALYDYERNTVFNANIFQSNAAGIPRAPLTWTQPGVEIDGPVLLPRLYNGRDKTFFMVNLENIITSAPATNIDTVPTISERSGNFSGLLQTNGSPITIYDPLTTTLTGGQYLRQAFPGNQIPANRLNPVSQAILGLIRFPTSQVHPRASTISSFRLTAEFSIHSRWAASIICSAKANVSQCAASAMATKPRADLPVLEARWLTERVMRAKTGAAESISRARCLPQWCWFRASVGNSINGNTTIPVTRSTWLRSAFRPR